MAKHPLKEIPLSSLKVGMHVSKLDISWIDSPFLTHTRVIKSNKDIALLKKAGAKKIIIDPNKGLDLEDEPEKEIDLPESELEVKPEPPPEPPKLVADNEAKKQSLKNELNAAINIRSQVKKAITNLHDDLAAGRAIKSDELSPLIDQTLESLERNNQALLNLAHITKRSQKLADHTFNTFCISLNLAQSQNLPHEDTEALGLAALVHEAGWAQIPIQLMGKRTRYTRNELMLVQKHTEIATKILSKSEIPELSKRIVAEHHELCDGSGYPNKLTTEQIHPLSRLFAVVDHYDEIVHQLIDKPGMLPTNALRTLYIAGKNNVFHEQCVAQLISLLGVYPVSSAIKLNSGAIGIVREVPADNHLRPSVEIHFDENGRILDTPYTLDLASKEATEKSLAIESVVDPNKSLDSGHHRLILEI